MGMQLRSRPARYTLGAGVATVLAIGTAGLVAAASAAASPASSAGGRHCSTSISKQNFGTANSGPYGGNQTVFRYTMTNSNCMQVRVIVTETLPWPVAVVGCCQTRLPQPTNPPCRVLGPLLTGSV